MARNRIKKFNTTSSTAVQLFVSLHNVQTPIKRQMVMDSDPFCHPKAVIIFRLSFSALPQTKQSENGFIFDDTCTKKVLIEKCLMEM